MVLVTQKTNKYQLELSLFPRHSKPFLVKEMVGEFRNPTKLESSMFYLFGQITAVLRTTNKGRLRKEGQIIFARGVMRLLRIELCSIRLANELQSCSKTKRKETKNYRCYISDILRFDHLHGMSVVSSKVSGMILDVALNADNFSL